MAKKLAFDKVLFGAVVSLVAFGLVMVFSASGIVAWSPAGRMNPFLLKQGIAAAVGVVAMAGAMVLDYRELKRPVVVYGLLLGAVVLLVATLFAPPVKGTRRWLFIAGLSVQSSELAKLALVPFVAYHIARKHTWEKEWALLLPTVVATALLAGLVLAQPDLGTAVILGAVTLLMLFLAGLSWRRLLQAGLVAAPALWLAIGMADYRRARLLAFLDPEKDPLRSGFQALQSLIAVGSGGLLGVGLGNSLQKLYFLPQPHSDFVFSIVAEELGLVGAGALLTVFAVVLWRGLRAGARAPDLFGRYLAWGFTGLLVMQALVNISVALVVLPTTGLPLPFISYGGSSLVVSMTAAGAVLNVSQHG